MPRSLIYVLAVVLAGGLTALGIYAPVLLYALFGACMAVTPLACFLFGWGPCRPEEPAEEGTESRQ